MAERFDPPAARRGPEFVEDQFNLHVSIQTESYTPELYAEVNRWRGLATAKVADALDMSYAQRFNDFAGMNFFGDGTDAQRAKNELEGRLTRLHEFMREMAP